MILAEAVQQPEPKPVDLAGLRAFMLRLYDGKLPSGGVDDLIAERQREAQREPGTGRRLIRLACVLAFVRWSTA